MLQLSDLSFFLAQAEKAWILACLEQSMFLLVPGMCMLISWLPTANQCKRAGRALPGLLA